MGEYTLDEAMNAFKTEVTPLVKEVLRAKIKRATPTTVMPGESELARLNPVPAVVSLSKKAQDAKDSLEKGNAPPWLFQLASGLLEEDITKGDPAKAQEHPWFGEVVHMVMKDDGQGEKDEEYPPFTMVVPLTNPNRHVYPLGKPCLTHGGRRAITFQVGEKGEAGEIMDGNDLPRATLEPRCIRYATDEEIDAFLDKLFLTFEAQHMMLGMLNYFEKEEQQAEKE